MSTSSLPSRVRTSPSTVATTNGVVSQPSQVQARSPNHRPNPMPNATSAQVTISQYGYRAFVHSWGTTSRAGAATSVMAARPKATTASASAVRGVRPRVAIVTEVTSNVTSNSANQRPTGPISSQATATNTSPASSRSSAPRLISSNWVEPPRGAVAGAGVATFQIPYCVANGSAGGTSPFAMRSCSHCCRPAR